MSYLARVTSEGGGLRLVVATSDGEPVASYPLAGDAAVLLAGHGWRVLGEQAGVIEVEPESWEALVAEATRAYRAAQAETERAYEAWQVVIRDAMREPGTVKTRIARAAGVHRDRAYQIRDGRR